MSRSELLELLTERSYSNQEVTLASGKKSNFYIDCRQTSLSGRGHRLIGLALLEAIERCEEQNGVPFASGASGPADPVHIGLTVKGGVVVDHQADAFHIKATGGDIGGDKHIHLALLEAFDRALSQ